MSTEPVYVPGVRDPGSRLTVTVREETEAVSHAPPVGVADIPVRIPAPSLLITIARDVAEPPCGTRTAIRSGEADAIGCDVTRMITGTVTLSAAVGPAVVTEPL